MRRAQVKREVLAQLATTMLEVSSWGSFDELNENGADRERLESVCDELREEFLRRAGDKTEFDGVLGRYKDRREVGKY